MSQEPVKPVPDPSLPVILIGAGDHARVLIDVLRLLGRHILFATDHNQDVHGSKVSGVSIKGADDCVFDHAPGSVALINAVGSVAKPTARRRVFDQFHGKGYHFDQVIHPTAIIAPSVELGEGAQVMAGVVIQPAARIGVNALINTQACVDHDCVIEPHVHIAPGVTLSGSVHVRDTAHIGTGAIVIQRITIGSGAVVGAGGVVVRDVPADTTVVGVPARPIRGGQPDQKPTDAPASSSTADGRKPPNVMISAAGRRVVLMRMFEQSIRDLGLGSDVIATDINGLSSAYHAASRSHLVPRYSDKTCLATLTRLCRDEQIGLIVPTIDPDLDFYTRHRAAISDAGATVLLSQPETIAIGNDKQATHDWLNKHGLPTVQQTDLQTLLGSKDGLWSYPLFVKPRFGSSSVGAQVIQNPGLLRGLPQDIPYIVQSLAAGREYTVDVFVDREGRCRCAVPRLRLETRGGEVSKGMTVRIRPVQKLARRVAEALPGAYGVLNIQIFYDRKTEALQVIEINPRFGGGYPLSHMAGAPMTRWVLEEYFDLPCTANDEEWRDGVVMLRYDEAVFVSRDEAGLNQHGELLTKHDKQSALQ